MELKDIFESEYRIQIAIEDLKKFAEENNLQLETEQQKRYALSVFIEKAMEDRDVDLAYFVVL